MQKIPTLFVREMQGRKAIATPEVNPECQWVMDGEGRATIKWDGTACLIRGGKLYKRHALKQGKPMPEGWLHWSFDPKQKTGHGWAPVVEGRAEDRWHLEADTESLADGTYELIGPRVQGNLYRREGAHTLVPHGGLTACPPRSFEGIRAYLEWTYSEGLVFHHPDGRMAKVKRRDFGIPWPVKRAAADCEGGE